ncbi:hypothetical protein D2T29_04630 [Sinirhodobacter populi]|uniref:Uncharacterized protein n=1 Tax=Paenirhodobacter populi TaxID=2306993 RepID=A0A443KN26_9RHOB|nr:hypothetical protein [Sinirhodobacter populi]RWR34189.1 hypothetical protein D2T29_04630 [Sinirhodobacter populi]
MTATIAARLSAIQRDDGKNLRENAESPFDWQAADRKCGRTFNWRGSHRAVGRLKCCKISAFRAFF